MIDFMYSLCVYMQYLLSFMPPPPTPPEEEKREQKVDHEGSHQHQFIQYLLTAELARGKQQAKKEEEEIVGQILHSPVPV